MKKIARQSKSNSGDFFEVNSDHEQKVILPEFFARPTLQVAEDLLGKFLVRKIKGEKIMLQINEVEAYDGTSDLACHASKGRTKRTEVLFGSPGYFYVYLCYGLHWLLNIVTGPKNFPSAVLLRGAGDKNGPAKLTKFLQIDQTFNAKKAVPENGLWFENHGILIHKKKIKKTPRIGVDYAGPVWSQKHYRFVYEI